MWIVFFTFAVLGVLVLMFYLLLELNELEKKITSLAQSIKDHYEKE